MSDVIRIYHNKPQSGDIYQEKGKPDLHVLAVGMTQIDISGKEYYEIWAVEKNRPPVEKTEVRANKP